VILPVVTLTILLAFGLDTLADLRPDYPRSAGSAGSAEVSPQAAHRIEIVGHTWWWRVRYHHPDFAEPIESANELRLPVGVPVEIALTSEDVIHAFWVPALGGKLDMIPGRTNRLVIEAGRAGVFRGQCAEYCGASHAHMAFIAEAMPPAEYDRWLRDQAKPFVPSQFEPDNRGLEIFLKAGCGACHQIRGTPAAGRIGPDLTHVGGRHTIAAGLYPTNAGTSAGWTAAAQELTPAARMPSFTTLSGFELRTLGEFLARLE
jgi:cytochrome c oxidase subunit 2